MGLIRGEPSRRNVPSKATRAAFRLAIASMASRGAPCGVPELAHGSRPGRLRGWFVFVDEAAEDALAPDPLLGEVGGGVVGPGRAELAAAVGSSSVVAGLVLGKDAAQVAFAEDEHPVGDLGPGGEHEPFGVGVRARTPGGIFTASMPVLARTASKDAANCPARSRMRYRKSAARSPRTISRLRACWVVRGPPGC